jgi:hypothetical protein
MRLGGSKRCYELMFCEIIGRKEGEILNGYVIKLHDRVLQETCRCVVLLEL